MKDKIIELFSQYQTGEDLDYRFANAFAGLCRYIVWKKAPFRDYLGDLHEFLPNEQKEKTVKEFLVLMDQVAVGVLDEFLLLTAQTIERDLFPIVRKSEG